MTSKKSLAKREELAHLLCDHVTSTFGRNWSANREHCISDEIKAWMTPLVQAAFDDGYVWSQSRDSKVWNMAFTVMWEARNMMLNSELFFLVIDKFEVKNNA